jgi:hypothetical protein
LLLLLLLLLQDGDDDWSVLVSCLAVLSAAACVSATVLFFCVTYCAPSV